MLRSLGISPRLRLGTFAAAVAAGRTWAWLTEPLIPRSRRGPRRQARERREGRRLAHTLGVLKGPYAKLGQFASLRYDVVPPILQAELAALRDRVPPLPFAAIRSAVESELGRPLESSFARFEPQPLGAASVAQAHAAELPDGSSVVVKVQYPWLAASLDADLRLLRRLLQRLLPGRTGPGTERLFAEFARGLEEELDFEREARIAGEIAANLADEPGVVVPRVLPALSTRRVLTMERHAAVPITDLGALRRLRIDPDEVVQTLVRAYARQVFVDGLFHADPHPGNLFVLEDASAGPRVLFVDFGLSRRLDPELRSELRQAIFCVLKGDADGFLDGMERLGMIAPGARPEVADAVTRMLERLRSGGDSPLQLGADRILALKDEAKQLLQETPGVQLPNDLLLYAKTISYLFALAQEIAPGADPMKPTLPWLLRFLAARD